MRAMKIYVYTHLEVPPEKGHINSSTNQQHPLLILLTIFKYQLSMAFVDISNEIQARPSQPVLENRSWCSWEVFEYPAKIQLDPNQT